MDWLRNMHDWMISRSAIMAKLYRCRCADCGHFPSSAAEELEERAVEGWDVFDGHHPLGRILTRSKIALSALRRKRWTPGCRQSWLDAGIVGISIALQ